jgi:pimeloyl-ACP methyl ester carboxylesterase
VNASRNYDPSPQLEKIEAPVMWINSGDDFINPPELGIAEHEVKRLKNGRDSGKRADVWSWDAYACGIVGRASVGTATEVGTLGAIEFSS